MATVKAFILLTATSTLATISEGKLKKSMLYCVTGHQNGRKVIQKQNKLLLVLNYALRHPSCAETAF
jgi:hypothetical protein